MRGIAKQRVWQRLGWPSSRSWQVPRGNTTAFAALGAQPRGRHAPPVHYKYRYRYIVSYGMYCCCCCCCCYCFCCLLAIHMYTACALLVYTCTQFWVLALPGLALETFDDVQVLLLIYWYWIHGTASLKYSWKYIYGRGPFILYPPLVCSNSASYPTGRSCRPSLSQLETALRWTNQAQLSCVLVCIICSTYDLVGLEMQRAWRDSALRV